MPVNIVKPGQEAQWDRAKQLAQTRGHSEDWPYITAIFKKLTHVKKGSQSDFDVHTQSGKRIPLPPVGVENMENIEVMGRGLVDRMPDWDDHDHNDAAMAHMVQGADLQIHTADMSSPDFTAAMAIARSHIRMSQVHSVAASYAGQRGDDDIVVKAEGAAAKKKRGAGSRGGDIVGYTRSGKVVYAPGHGHQIGYTSADHHDAAKQHLEAAKKLNTAKLTAKTPNAVGRLRTKILRHLDIAQAHLDAQHEQEAKPIESPAIETKPVEAEKPADKQHKYIKREKGPDGKWIYTYAEDAQKKPRKKKEPKAVAEEAKEAVKEDTAPGTPRAEAAAEEKATEAAEYEFARKSKISNKGEDLKNSARHKRNQWTTLAAAEMDGTASVMVRRDNLLAAYPIDFFALLDEYHPEQTIAAMLVIKKFPAEPVGLDKVYKDADPDSVYETTWQNDTGRKVNIKGTGNYLEAQGFKPVASITVKQASEKARKDYYDAFMRVRTVVEDSAKNHYSVSLTLSAVRKEVSSIVDAHRKENGGYDDGLSSLLRRYHNTTLSSYGKGTSVTADLQDYSHLAAGGTPDQALEASKKILEGKSVKQAFGVKGPAREKQFDVNPADLYADLAERVGPSVLVLSTQESQEAALLKSNGMRGLQWGNSVTDDERAHHLKEAALAFNDLAEVTGLPPAMASFNGRLGLAFGARGRKGALAHYEPDQRVINLTRKGGVGTLAHEWGHFFDNILSELHGTGKHSFLSSTTAGYYGSSKSSVSEAMNALTSSPGWKTFAHRMMRSNTWGKLSSNRRAYWGSNLEMFARSFERHVYDKLAAQGRKNTYLSGIKVHEQSGEDNREDTELWPNAEETKQMAPLFDSLFEKFKNSDMLTKALAMMEKGSLSAVAGAGSRGGVVIGRTASGKPTYKHNGARAAQVAKALAMVNDLQKNPRIKNAHENAPKGYPKSKKQYADPAHFKYPVDTEEHVRAAIGYFSKTKNSRMYSVEQRKQIWSRIHGAAKKHGIDMARFSKGEVGMTRERLNKAEGARGGHIIGHTKSGKPIYRASIGNPEGSNKVLADNAKAVRATHPTYSAQDHADAAEKHAEDYEKQDLDNDDHTAFHTAQAHHQASKNMKLDQMLSRKTEKSMDLSKAEGTRGGHIIGHTKSGKAIYSAESSKHYPKLKASHAYGRGDAKYATTHHPGYTPADHADAYEAHVADAHRHNGFVPTSEFHKLAAAQHHKAAAKQGGARVTDKYIGSRHPDLATGKSMLSKAEKKGEGSRGGKISGYTRSGKPIYEATGNSKSQHYSRVKPTTNTSQSGHAARSVHNQYKKLGYTAQDHFDAAEHHMKGASQMREASFGSGGEEAHKHHVDLYSASDAHRQAGMIQAGIENPQPNHKKARKSVTCPECQVGIDPAYALKSVAALAKGHGVKLSETMGKLVKGPGIAHMTCPGCVAPLGADYVIKSLGILSRQDGGQDIQPALEGMFKSLRKSVAPQVLPGERPQNTVMFGGMQQLDNRADLALARAMTNHGGLLAQHHTISAAQTHHLTQNRSILDQIDENSVFTERGVTSAA